MAREWPMALPRAARQAGGGATSLTIRKTTEAKRVCPPASAADRRMA
jgi:hypothetical protein